MFSFHKEDWSAKLTAAIKGTPEQIGVFPDRWRVMPRQTNTLCDAFDSDVLLIQRSAARFTFPLQASNTLLCVLKLN